MSDSVLTRWINRSAESSLPDLREMVRTKFAQDSLFNLSSIVILAVFGILLNLLIARYHTPQVLGTFNLAYAVYILAAQIATMGVQVSTLKHLAEFPEDSARCSAIIISSLILTTLSACLFSALLYLSRQWCAQLLNSPALDTAILCLIPGLFFFVLNKLFFNILNGFRLMKAYSAFTSLRFLLLLAALICALALKVAGAALTVIFSAAESTLFILLAAYCIRLVRFTGLSDLVYWMRTHLLFGFKGHAGMIAERLNTRIDILMLGVLTSDYYVGIYSFAAMIVEGINQVPGVLRLNVDPILSRLSVQNKKDEVREIVSVWRKWIILLMSLTGLVVTAVFPFLIDLLGLKSEFHLSLLVLFILISGTILQSAYVPFMGILVQSGFPGLHSVLIAAASLTIVVCSLILVPFWDINGTALSVFLASVVFVLTIKCLTKRAIGIHI